MDRMVIMLLFVAIMGCARSKELQRLSSEMTNIEQKTVVVESIDDVLMSVVNTIRGNTTTMSEDVKLTATIVTEDLDSVGRVVKRQVANVGVSNNVEAVMRDTVIESDTTIVLRNTDRVIVDTTVVQSGQLVTEDIELRSSSAMGAICIVAVSIVMLFLAWLLLRPRLL